jgi:hypothetical protein
VAGLIDGRRGRAAWLIYRGGLGVELGEGIGDGGEREGESGEVVEFESAAVR